MVVAIGTCVGVVSPVTGVLLLPPPVEELFEVEVLAPPPEDESEAVVLEPPPPQAARAKSGKSIKRACFFSMIPPEGWERDSAKRR